MSIAPGLRHLLVILAVAAGPAILSGVLHPHAPSWRAETAQADSVTLDTIAGWTTPPQWVDARPAAAYQAGHVPGAQPLQLESWDAQIQAVIEAWRPGRPVVVYCDQRACQESRHVAAALRRDYGLDQVWVLHGGWAAWLARSPR